LRQLSGMLDEHVDRLAGNRTSRGRSRGSGVVVADPEQADQLAGWGRQLAQAGQVMEQEIIDGTWLVATRKAWRWE
jgi:hypothetical protein